MEFIVSRLRAKLKRGEPIVSITAYDYFTALIAREAAADFVLVGDSLGNVIQGAETTVGVTLNEVIYHTKLVCRHFSPGRVVLDMPFGSFKLNAAETISNAARAFKETGCGAVKFEGATSDNLIAIEQLTQAGVPVLGHLGLLPQRVHAAGGYRMQGKTEKQTTQLLADAKALENAGAFAVVLECVVPKTAAKITEALKIPTIGIGSGNDTDGQIVVIHDILGMLPGEAPSFAKQYASLFDDAALAASRYAKDVLKRTFPEDGSGQEAQAYGGGRKTASE